MMNDKEKIIKALEYCTHSDDCLGCIHWQKVAKGEKCTVREDALALLEEQDKEIENLKEIIIKADYALEIVKEKINELLYEDFRRVSDNGESL